jgi:EpsD family peptidyl-prolyl cis-trans isomerase
LQINGFDKFSSSGTELIRSFPGIRMKKIIQVVALLGGALVLTGCSQQEEAEPGPAAATVNGITIPVAQIEADMAKLGQVPAGQSAEMGNRILKNVVDQELLAQQAIMSKLDALPDVQMKIAAARRQILAEAKIDVLTQNAVQPGETEIKTYFDAHPELFSQRRIYKVQELIVTTTPEKIGEVAAMASQAKSPQAFAASVQAKGLPVSAREAIRAAEDLPSELVVKLSQLKNGQSMTQTQGGKFTLIILVASESRPVDLSQASPMIERYLLNADKREKVEVELSKLRGQTKIEYFSPYAAIPLDSQAKKIK